TLRLRGRDKRLPIALGLASLPLLMRAARRTAVNHIFASPAERILTPRLARLERTILTITKGAPSLRRLEENLGALRSLRHIVVESEHHRELLMQLGLEAERVHMIYPGLAPEGYRAAPGPFTILFATSPRKLDL